MQKTSLILLFCSILSVHTLQAEETFGTLEGNLSYTYDAAGNRISRTIMLGFGKTQAMPDDEMPENADDEPPLVDVLNNLQIKIFPNPTRGELAVEIASTGGEQVQITLFSINGEFLLTKQAATSRTTVDLSAFPTGNYILMLTVDGQNRQYKIVKL